MFRGIGAGGQFTFHRGLGQHIGVGYQGANGVDHTFHGRHDAGGIACAQGYLAGEIADRD